MIIIASKDGIQQCAVVLHEFPMAKYTQYIELRGQEMVLKEKDVILSEQQFGLKQKEHGTLSAHGQREGRSGRPFSQEHR